MLACKNKGKGEGGRGCRGDPGRSNKIHFCLGNQIDSGQFWHGRVAPARAYRCDRYGIAFPVRKFGSARNGKPIWQRNYYEHILLNEADMQRIEAYILANPQRWEQDQLHPLASPNKFKRDR